MKLDEKRYQGETYYELPALKRSHWGKLIAGYFWVGGIAGSAQVLAQLADLVGRGRHCSVVRNGRYLALLGSLVSPVLLIADLHKPRRWYNMLRIVRPTSAMSLGAWSLALFGAFSSGAAAAQYMEDQTGNRRFRWCARLLGIPAAGLGAIMSTYTGALLSTTSTPLWSAAGRLLPSLFGTSAMSTATAALLLLERSDEESASAPALESLGLISSTAEAVAALAVSKRLNRAQVEAPLQEQPLKTANQLAHVIGIGAPVALYALQHVSRSRSRRIAVSAAVAALAGGLLMRHVWMTAGNRSAQRPQDYFRRARGGSDVQHRMVQRPRYGRSRQSEQLAARPLLAQAGSAERPMAVQLPTDLQSIARQREAVLEALMRATEQKFPERRQQLARTESLLVQLRDQLIARLRDSDGSEARAAEQRLQQVNVALSLLVAVEFPESGVQSELLDQAAKALTRW